MQFAVSDKGIEIKTAVCTFSFTTAFGSETQLCPINPNTLHFLIGASHAMFKKHDDDADFD